MAGEKEFRLNNNDTWLKDTKEHYTSFYSWLKELKSSDAEAEAIQRRLIEKELREENEKARKRLEQEVHKQKLINIIDESKFLNDKMKEAGKVLVDTVGDNLSKTVEKTYSSLQSNLNNTINSYVENIEALNTHLTGSNREMSSIMDNLQKVLGTSSLVKQQDVYNNLNNLVRQGITSNVEQRAFLQTLAKDMDLMFNAANGSLTRLIRIQGEDISSSRMSIEYSLQQFLNQNYQTSEYIKDAFTGVSEAILDMQSLVSATNAADLEASIQTYLGSYYSAGVSSNTVKSLASAFNALGSGDISNVGSGISNLVMMAAARAGLDYGNLLNNGVTTDDIALIMSSMTSYLNDINNSAGSNVVKSQLSSLFGIGISDLSAIGNVQQAPSGSVTSNFGTAFSDVNSLLPGAKKLTNTFSNIMYTWGTNIASNDALYTTHYIAGLIEKSGIGDLVSDIGSATGSKLVKLAGTALNYAQMVSIIPSLLMTIGDLSSSDKVGNAASSILAALGTSASTVSTVKSSGQGVSASMTYSNGSDLQGLISSLKTSANDVAESVTVQGEEESSDDLLKSISLDVSGIYDILNSYADNINRNIENILDEMTSASYSRVGG